jgi:hypothetical protein
VLVLDEFAATWFRTISAIVPLECSSIVVAMKTTFVRIHQPSPILRHFNNLAQVVHSSIVDIPQLA